jgi:hypothetical protein
VVLTDDPYAPGERRFGRFARPPHVAAEAEAL